MNACYMKNTERIDDEEAMLLTVASSSWLHHGCQFLGNGKGLQLEIWGHNILQVYFFCAQ